jgi:capsular polysaccharide biosynthesis protein
MELNEAGRRIVGQHWRLILFCIFLVLATIGFATLVRGGGQTYTASARLVLDTDDPKTRSESTSIADTAKAIATSPAQVRAALQDAHVTTRDPLDVAEHHVSIRALGTSAVLQLSVSDRDRRVAAAVANALAARVIRARLNVSNGQLQQVLTDVEQRIDGLSLKIAGADAQIDSLNVQLASAKTGASANALRASRDAATRSRDFLTQQRAVLEAERVSLLSTDALRPKPSILSPATVPKNADASHWLSYTVLGTLLGLILGVGSAGLLEVIRPTLVGSDVLARELDTPLLGTLPNEPDADASAEALHPTSARLALAAEGAGVRTVALFPAVADLDLSRLARRLEGIQRGALDQTQGTLPMDGARRDLHIRPFVLQDSSAAVEGGAGLVLVAPTEMKKADLLDVGQFLRLTPLHLLGLVAYTPQSSRRRLPVREGTLENPVAGQARASTPET